MPLARSIGCSASGPSRRSGGRPSAGAGQQRTRSTSPGSRCRGGFPAGPVRVVARDVELKHVRRELLLPLDDHCFAGSARRGSRINNRDRERSRRNGGTTSAESRVGHAATCSVAGRVRSAVHPGPEHAAARGVLRPRRSASPWVCLESSTVAPRPWWAASAFTKFPRTRSASDTMRSARSQARRAVAAGDADPNRFRSGAPSPNPAVRRVP